MDTPWTGYLTPGSVAPVIIVQESNRRLITLVSVPCLFKGCYVGQLLAWISSDSVFQHLMSANSIRPSYIRGLVCPPDRFFVDNRDVAAQFPQTLAGDFLHSGKSAVYFRGALAGSGPEDLVALRVAVGETPFYLTTVIREADLFGGITPWKRTAVLGVLAAGFLSGLSGLWLLYIRNAILNTRIDESAKRQAEVAEKNFQLEREIAQRRRTDKALRESEAKYRSIFESFQDVYFRTDLDGRITVISPSIQAEGGFRPEEVVGQSPARFFAWEEEYQRFGKVFRTAGQVADYELSLRRKEGRVVHTSLTARMIRDDQGAPHGVEGVLRNISARKQAERQIRKYQESLEQMVAERTRELEKAQAALVSKAMEAGRAQLSAMVLHNIGNAITPVNVQIESLASHRLGVVADYLKRCYAELHAQRDCLGEFVARHQRGREIFDYMGQLVDELDVQRRQQEEAAARIQRAIVYIAEILSLQQSYAAAEEEHRELVDLNRLVTDAVQMQSAALKKHGIEVDHRLTPDLPRLLIDRNRLMQVVVNLIKNGYEAIAERNGQAQEKRITVATGTDDGQVVLEIHDSGVGIAPDAIDSVFTFGHSSKGSSGFGLHYCKIFIDANQGTLGIDSPGSDQGATVWVRFKTPAGTLL